MKLFFLVSSPNQADILIKQIREDGHRAVTWNLFRLISKIMIFLIKINHLKYPLVALHSWKRLGLRWYRLRPGKGSSRRISQLCWCPNFCSARSEHDCYVSNYNECYNWNIPNATTSWNNHNPGGDTSCRIRSKVCSLQ